MSIKAKLKGLMTLAVIGLVVAIGYPMLVEAPKPSPKWNLDPGAWNAIPKVDTNDDEIYLIVMFTPINRPRPIEEVIIRVSLDSIPVISEKANISHWSRKMFAAKGSRIVLEATQGHEPSNGIMQCAIFQDGDLLAIDGPFKGKGSVRCQIDKLG